MEYLYQIKVAVNDYDKQIAAQGIIEKKSKKEVLKFLEEEFPEYFDGNKVAQKLSKKTDQVVYVSLHELTEHWKKYWTSEVECMICHSKVQLLELKQHLGYFNIKKFTCSMECEEKRKEREPDEFNEYWNDRCRFFYIYKITNKLDGKVYIGYTEREPLFRWWEHIRHSHLPIGAALKNEGIENFTFEVLEKYSKEEKTIEEMHEIETKYIHNYDSISNGYNCIASKSCQTKKER